MLFRCLWGLWLCGSPLLYLTLFIARYFFPLLSFNIGSWLNLILLLLFLYFFVLHIHEYVRVYSFLCFVFYPDILQHLWPDPRKAIVYVPCTGPMPPFLRFYHVGDFCLSVSLFSFDWVQHQQQFAVLESYFSFLCFSPSFFHLPTNVGRKTKRKSSSLNSTLFFFYLNPLSLSQTRQDERDYLRNFVKPGAARWTGFSIHACSACESSNLVFCFNLCCFPCPQRVVNCLCACFHGSLLPLPESRKALVFVIRSCFFFPKKKW